MTRPLPPIEDPHARWCDYCETYGHEWAHCPERELFDPTYGDDD